MVNVINLIHSAEICGYAWQVKAIISVWYYVTWV